MSLTCHSMPWLYHAVSWLANLFEKRGWQRWHITAAVFTSKILQRVDANAEDVHVLPCPSLETRDKNTSNLNNGNSASHYFYLCFNTQSTCPGYLCTHQPSIFRWCESCVCELIHVIIQNINMPHPSNLTPSLTPLSQIHHS